MYTTKSKIKRNARDNLISNQITEKFEKINYEELLYSKSKKHPTCISDVHEEYFNKTTRTFPTH